MLNSHLSARGLGGTFLVLWVVLGCGSCLAADQDRPEKSLAATPGRKGETVVLPEILPDPFEPFNRAMWAFNRGLLTKVVRPTAKVYRVVVGPPLREGISNFGRNITYPGRLINNLFQARWSGAWDETLRFGCNSVLGLGGFIDVASRFDIQKSDADFGQTFGTWGWQPDFFLMLPIFGPSSDRDTVGIAADSAANPLNYITPYPKLVDQPATYFSPYTYATAVVTYNNLADSVEGYTRFTKTEADPYADLAYAWGYARDTQRPDFTVKDPPDQASLETLQSIYLSNGDPNFPGRGRTRSVALAGTGKKLPFTYWLQTGTAPVVYIVPGIGSHRLSGGALGLAELLVNNGFSAVCVSNPFNYEFMNNASTAAVPGYTPIDVEDLRDALAAIHANLSRTHPGRIGAKALLGYSMGAFESLFLAGTEPAGTNRFAFDRYVAIDTPVRLLYGVSKLDDFFQAPLAWPAETRQRSIENTFRKVAALIQSATNSASASAVPPFSGIESKFLVGSAFRLILRDAIFTSQSHHNFGVLHHKLDPLRRAPAYREILQYSFQEYFARFVTPYYLKRGVDLGTPDALERASDLRSYGDALRHHPFVRVLVNQNDFLLAPEDLEWLKGTLGAERLTVFPRGGHLGNLEQPAVQKIILKSLSGLGSLQPGFETAN
jgi:ABC-type transporter lipoprotein component MlaA/pimeloyl-ACP methyl ester carboxylesterase